MTGPADDRQICGSSAWAGYWRRIALSAPWYCIAIHIAALAATSTVLRGGLLTEPDVVRRAEYIAAHAVVWKIGWLLWMLSATSIVAFYVWWGSQLRRLHPTGLATSATTIAVLIAAVGMACNITGESISAFKLVNLARTAAKVPAVDSTSQFLAAERSATLLTAGAANLLYTIGGVVLMFATPEPPKWVRVAMWTTWLAGVLMTCSAIAGWTTGIVITTILLFPTLIAWVAWMGIRWRRQ